MRPRPLSADGGGGSRLNSLALWGEGGRRLGEGAVAKPGIVEANLRDSITLPNHFFIREIPGKPPRHKAYPFLRDLQGHPDTRHWSDKAFE